MPLARSATTQAEPTQTQSSSISEVNHTIVWEDIPLDIFRQFSVELGTVEKKEIGKIRDIYEWAKSKCDEPTIGNIMQRINSMENQLGSPSLNEKRWDKLWNWVKITRQIDDLEKRRDAYRKRWL